MNQEQSIVSFTFVLHISTDGYLIFIAQKPYCPSAFCLNNEDAPVYSKDTYQFPQVMSFSWILHCSIMRAQGRPY